MPYKLTPAAWLAKETERAKGVLLTHMQPGVAYTAEQLIAMLLDYGLDYSSAVLQQIGAELIKQGTIQVV